MPDSPKNQPENEVPRRHPRHTLTAFVDYSGASRYKYQRVQNISLGGICISTPMLEEVGTEVDLVIQFPDLDATFDVAGQVIWVNDKELSDMGVRFLDMNAEREQRLQSIIDRLQST